MNITFKERAVPIKYEYDVVVVGGGTAGAIAGIAAAREGAKTLIVERFGCLGGTQTMALVTPIMPEGMSNGNAESYLSKEIRKSLTKKGFAHKFEGSFSSWFDGEMLKLELEQMAIESNCDILYDSTLIEAVVSDGAVSAIIVANKGGLEAISAKQFIDCTGDADLAVLAGAEYQKGDDTGKNQAVSLRFEAINIDLDRFGEWIEQGGQSDDYTRPPLLSTFKGGICPAFDKLLIEKHEQGYLTSQDIKYIQVFSIPGKPGTLSFNCPELGDSYNAIDPVYMSKKYCEGKASANRLINCLREFVPGFENASIGKFAPLLGIRESRRIVGEYHMSVDDVMGYEKFDDRIAMSDYEIDVHGASVDTLANKSYNKALPKDQQYFTIPFRSLIAKGYKNLMAAGRCGGFDFFVQSTVRVQHTCRYTGEAAGIGAALAVKKSCSISEINGSDVRKIMVEHGADLY